MKLFWLHLRTSSKALAVLAVLLLSAVGTLQAQSSDAAPGTFRVGKKDIKLPAPSSEFAEIGNDYRSLAEAMVPDTNRLIAAFLLPDELKAVTTSGGNLSRYMLVEVPRRAEFVDVTPEMFKEVTDGMGSQFGALLDSKLKDTETELNRKLKALSESSATVSLDKPTMLGTLFTMPDASCFGAIMPVKTAGKTSRTVMGIILLRAQQRVLFSYVYAPYENESTVKWVQSTAQNWATAILAANK